MSKTFLGVLVSEGFDPRNSEHTANLEATHRALEGHDPRGAFGPLVEYDRIKFTRWSPDTCGCVIDFMWHRDTGGDGQPPRVHHPHRTHKVCAEHEAVAGNRDAHHAELHAKNAHKNLRREELARELGVDAGEITHGYEDDHTLVLYHPKLPTDYRRYPRNK